MRLYHHPMSSNARRAHMAAVELGVALDLELVDLAKGEHKKPSFLRLNPSGRVPVLDDDGFFLTESHAIMIYLADKTPGQTLYPTALRARADVNRWLFWSAQHFQPAVSVLNWEHVVKRFTGQGDPDPAAVQRGEALVTECARVLDAHLAGRTWISDQGLSLADLAVAAPLMSLAAAKLPVGGYASLLGWFERVQGLEAWRQTGA